MAQQKVIMSWLGTSPKDKIVNVVLILVALVALYFAVRFVWGQIKGAFSGEAQALRNQLNSGEKLSYQKYEYNNMADSLFTAMKGLGTDTDTIYNIFYRMNNKADVLQLVVSFGVRKGENLQQWMQGETKLSISKINNILATKGIDYRF